MDFLLDLEVTLGVREGAPEPAESFTTVCDRLKEVKDFYKPICKEKRFFSDKGGSVDVGIWSTLFSQLLEGSDVLSEYRSPM